MITIEELAQACKDHIEMGLGNTPFILKMKRKSKRKSKRMIKSNLVRTPFGLCRWCHWSENEIVIYVSVNQIEKYIKKQLRAQNA